jgi:hypothetical protein
MSIEWLLVKTKGTDEHKDSLVKELPNEVKLNCNCGFEGIYATYQADFKFIGKDKKGYAYFRCPNCTRHLWYDISNGKTKIKKRFFHFRPLKSG